MQTKEGLVVGAFLLGVGIGALLVVLWYFGARERILREFTEVLHRRLHEHRQREMVPNSESETGSNVLEFERQRHSPTPSRSAVVPKERQF